MIAIRRADATAAAALAVLLAQLGYAASAAAAVERLGKLDPTGRDPIFLACDGSEVLGLLALHIAPMLQYARPVARITFSSWMSAAAAAASAAASLPMRSPRPRPPAANSSN